MPCLVKGLNYSVPSFQIVWLTFVCDELTAQKMDLPLHAVKISVSADS
jgi:hypothetical protein